MCHQEVSKSESIAPLFLTPALHESGLLHAAAVSPREKIPRYLLDRRFDGPQNRFGRCGQNKILLPFPGIETRISIP
jgi:hypothetical protein